MSLTKVKKKKNELYELNILTLFLPINIFCIEIFNG